MDDRMAIDILGPFDFEKQSLWVRFIVACGFASGWPLGATGPRMESQLEGEANFSSGTVGERDGAAGAGGYWNSADVLAVLRQLADPERASVLLA